MNKAKQASFPLNARGYVESNRPCSVWCGLRILREDVATGCEVRGGLSNVKLPGRRFDLMSSPGYDSARIVTDLKYRENKVTKGRKRKNGRMNEVGEWSKNLREKPFRDEMLEPMEATKQTSGFSS
jgi:hypothetical protein